MEEEGWREGGDEEQVPPSLELEVRFVRHFFAAKILLVIGL